MQYIFSLGPTLPTVPPCKRGFERVGNAVTCSDKNECSSQSRCGDDSLCQNYLGGFDCECKDPGHFKVNVNGRCKPCETFSGTLTISNREWNFPLKNKSTEDFYDMKEDFETTVNDELKKSSVGEYYYGCRVKDLRSGSIIVDFLIFTSPDFVGTIQDLQDALVGQVNNTKLGSFEVTTSKVSVEDFDECKAHQDNCGHHATCVNKEGSFECKCNDGFEGDGISCEGVLTDEGNSTEVIIIVLSCFVALLIIIIGVLVCLLRRKRNAVPEITTGDAPRANAPDLNTRNDPSLDQHTSTQRLYMELSPRPPSDIKPYAALQHSNASHGYYNVSFSREETQADEYEEPLPFGVQSAYEEII